jgi:hypothetical protein
MVNGSVIQSSAANLSLNIHLCIADTKKLLNDFSKTIDDQLSKLKDVPKDVTKEIDQIKMDLQDITDLVDTYDGYR